MIVLRRGPFWILCGVGLFFVVSGLAGGPSDETGALLLFSVIGIFLWSAVFFWVDTKLSRAGFILVILYLVCAVVNLWQQGCRVF